MKTLSVKSQEFFNKNTFRRVEEAAELVLGVMGGENDTDFTAVRIVVKSPNAYNLPLLELGNPAFGYIKDGFFVAEVPDPWDPEADPITIRWYVALLGSYKAFAIKTLDLDCVVVLDEEYTGEAGFNIKPAEQAKPAQTWAEFKATVDNVDNFTESLVGTPFRWFKLEDSVYLRVEDNPNQILRIIYKSSQKFELTMGSFPQRLVFYSTPITEEDFNRVINQINERTARLFN